MMSIHTDIASIVVILQSRTRDIPITCMMAICITCMLSIMMNTLSKLTPSIQPPAPLSHANVDTMHAGMNKFLMATTLIISTMECSIIHMAITVISTDRYRCNSKKAKTEAREEISWPQFFCAPLYSTWIQKGISPEGLAIFIDT